MNNPVLHTLYTISSSQIHRSQIVHTSMSDMLIYYNVNDHRDHRYNK